MYHAAAYILNAKIRSFVNVLWVGWIGTHHFDGIGQHGDHQLVFDGGGLVGNGKMRTLQSLDSFCKLTKHICS